MSAQEIANLRAQIAALTTTLTETKERMNSLETNATVTVTVTDQYQDCAPNITDASQINLEIFKMLPIFTGDTNHYRSWRKRAWTHMENIKNYATTPTYYTALSIVHSKIQGEAADILINHNTKFNFYSIINRLDYTYADQRPLYVLLEAMKRIKQGKRTLAEFHSEVSKSLNLALTKVEMDSSGNPSAMKEYANQEAVRTFILGLNSKYTSGTLYSHSPKDLETAYAIASTIHHDNVNLQFDFPQYNHRHYNASPSRRYEEPQRYRPNVQVQYNQTAPRQEHQPMEIDPSQKYTRSTNYNRNHSAPQNSYDRQRQGLPPNNPFRGEPQKRERNPSSRNFNIQQKVQRVNQTRDEQIQSLAPENDEYETGSVFLGV